MVNIYYNIMLMTFIYMSHNRYVLLYYLWIGKCFNNIQLFK